MYPYYSELLNNTTGRYRRRRPLYTVNPVGKRVIIEAGDTNC